MGYLVTSLYFGWFIWSAWSDRPTEALSHYVPGRVAILIWASWLILAPIGRGPLDVPDTLRVLLAGLFLISCLLLPVAVRSYLVASTVVGVVLAIEQVWLIPWWKSGWKRDRQAR
jgi:hypothetical protein